MSDEEDIKTSVGTIVKSEGKYFISVTEENGEPFLMDFDPDQGFIDLYQRYHPPQSVVVGQVIHMPIILLNKDIGIQQIRDLQLMMRLTGLYDEDPSFKEVFEKALWEYRRKYQSTLWDFETKKWLGPEENEPRSELSL